MAVDIGYLGALEAAVEVENVAPEAAGYATLLLKEASEVRNTGADMVRKLAHVQDLRIGAATEDDWLAHLFLGTHL